MPKTASIIGNHNSQLSILNSINPFSYYAQHLRRHRFLNLLILHDDARLAMLEEMVHALHLLDVMAAVGEPLFERVEVLRAIFF